MIEKISAISREAGKKIAKIYVKNTCLQLSYKKDNTPVTIADFVSHKFINSKLKILKPCFPILSEENIFDWKVRQCWKNYWLVDPLDGTKEFLCRNGEFTINIALIKDGQPIMGVVYEPIKDVLYAAYRNKAWKIYPNGDKIYIKVKKQYPPIVLLSRSHNNNNAELDKYLTKIGNHQIIYISSSLKFCLIADGSAQMYPRFSPTNIWDTAAGHAIALAAGAKIMDWHGKPLNYIPRKSLLNPGFNVFLF